MHYFFNNFCCFFFVKFFFFFLHRLSIMTDDPSASAVRPLILTFHDCTTEGVSISSAFPRWDSSALVLRTFNSQTFALPTLGRTLG